MLKWAICAHFRVFRTQKPLKRYSSHVNIVQLFVFAHVWTQTWSSFWSWTFWRFGKASRVYMSKVSGQKSHKDAIYIISRKELQLFNGHFGRHLEFGPLVVEIRLGDNGIRTLRSFYFRISLLPKFLPNKCWNEEIGWFLKLSSSL